MIKTLEFNGKIGRFDKQTHNGTFELYVPCSDHNIYILQADQLAGIDTIRTEKPVYAVAVNS
jgi:hypothetical protein